MFNGKRFRADIAPRIAEFICAQDPAGRRTARKKATREVKSVLETGRLGL